MAKITAFRSFCHKNRYGTIFDPIGVLPRTKNGKRKTSGNNTTINNKTKTKQKSLTIKI